MKPIAGLLLAATIIASPALAEPTRTAARQIGRPAFLALLQAEAGRAGLPWGVADAVAAIESSYDPTRIGGVGEIGLMQVRPGTAAMMGFVGSANDLMKPETNIHYGVAYLAGAWKLTGGDLCRTLMKYRAGHGENEMSPLSATYCQRAKAHLASVGSTLAGDDIAVQPMQSQATAKRSSKQPAIPTLNGTRLRGPAFWAAHDARVKALRSKVARRWRQLAAT